MSNNWRKMHGLPLLRKSTRRIDRPRDRRQWYRCKGEEGFRMLYDYYTYIDNECLRRLYVKTCTI